MSTLFRHIKPAQKFRITKRQIAKFLRISESLIVKVESWNYVLFVHRQDKGGQFISYRQLEQWKNAVACQLQKCTTKEQLEHLWNAIAFDHTKHNKQYDDSVLPFLEKICLKCLEAILKDSQTRNRARAKGYHFRVVNTNSELFGQRGSSISLKREGNWWIEVSCGR
jgi:hypothetical protein